MSARLPVRFDLLDGLRGLAAVAVMIYHYSQHNGVNWLSAAWVAVDLFFVLSGFVIAHSYSKHILAGMSFGQFMRLRLIRLAPLYMVGLALGILTACLTLMHGRSSAIGAPEILKAAGLGLLFLPYLNQLAWPFGAQALSGPVFPLNGPAWSLFFEIAVNIAFFFHLRRTKQPASWMLVLMAYLLFFALSLHLDIVNPGWGFENFIFGFPRVTAGFFMGALIFRAGLQHKRVPMPLVLGMASLTLLCFLRNTAKTTMGATLFLVPMTVAMASTAWVSGTARKLCEVLGNLSYPIYIIHFPLYQLALELTPLDRLPPVRQVIIMAITAVVLAWLLVPIDQWARRRLLSLTATTKLRTASS